MKLTEAEMRMVMYGIHASPPLLWFSNSNFKC